MSNEIDKLRKEIHKQEAALKKLKITIDRWKGETPGLIVQKINQLAEKIKGEAENTLNSITIMTEKYGELKEIIELRVKSQKIKKETQDIIKELSR